MKPELEAELQKIANRMKGQDNRITANPVFMVQQRWRTFGLDPTMTDKVVWAYEGNDVAKTHEDLVAFLQMNELDEDECLESGDLVKTGYTDIYVSVQPFFSATAAEAYIKANRHNLTDPRVYVDSAYRNEEWQAVRKVLLDLQVEDKTGGKNE